MGTRRETHMGTHMVLGFAAHFRAMIALCSLGIGATLLTSNANAATLEIFHADSLRGPMQELKQAFEASNPGIAINLTSGTSRRLADRIL